MSAESAIPTDLLIDETAETLRMSTDNVKRGWRLAKACLERAIGNRR